MAIFGILAWTSSVSSQKTYHYPKEAQETITPLTSLTATPSPDNLKAATNWIMSNSDIGEEFYRTIQCESNFVYYAYNPLGNSFGVGQFIPQTWNLFNKTRGTNLNYKSSKDQLEMMAWAFENGLQSNWDCYCNLFGRENAQCIKRMGWK